MVPLVWVTIKRQRDSDDANYRDGRCGLTAVIVCRDLCMEWKPCRGWCVSNLGVEFVR